MAMKKDNKDWVLVGLLLLALIGKGSFATPPAPKTTDMTTTTDNGSSSSSGKNSSPPDYSGGNTKNAPSSDTNMPGGVPDKSKTMPGGGPGMATFMMPGVIDNAGVKFAQMQVALINAQKGMATPEGMNTFLVNNLGGTPGASVTTAIYNSATGMYDFFTNNEYLFSMMSPGKMPGMSIPERVKQPVPSMVMPMMIPAAVPSAARPPMGPTPMMMSPGLVTIVTNIKAPGMTIPEMVKQPAPNPLAFENLNNPSYVKLQDLLAMMAGSTPMVPSPLPAMPNFLQMLFNLGGGFGQQALQNLKSSEIGLSNLFGGIKGFVGIPGSPGIAIAPEIAV